MLLDLDILTTYAVLFGFCRQAKLLPLLLSLNGLFYSFISNNFEVELSHKKCFVTF